MKVSRRARSMFWSLDLSASVHRIVGTAPLGSDRSGWTRQRGASAFTHLLAAVLGRPRRSRDDLYIDSVTVVDVHVGAVLVDQHATGTDLGLAETEVLVEVERC